MHVSLLRMLILSFLVTLLRLVSTLVFVLCHDVNQRGAVFTTGRTAGATAEKFRGVLKQTSKRLTHNAFASGAFHIGGNF